MPQSFTAAIVDDDGLVLQPLIDQAFTAGFVADVGQVLAPTLLREWGPNATTDHPAGAPSQATPLPESAVQVVDMDHVHVAWLPERIADLARASLTDPGAVSVTLAKTDPAAPTGYNRMLRYWLRGELGACGLIEPRDDQTISQDEEAGETVVLGGRGSLAVLDDDVIEPWALSWYPDMQAHRMSFAHPDYDDSTWGIPYVKALQGGSSPWWVAFPRGWDDPAAAWISGPVGNSENAPDGTMYIRGYFTIPTTGQYAMFWTGDNTAELWLDGVPISTIQNWQQLQRVDLDLSAGDHVLAVEVVNFPQSYANPMGFLFTLRSLDGRGQLGDVVFRTSSSATDWKVLQFPSTTPGWPLGAIINYFLDLREAHGGRTIARTFTDTTDTAGAPFPTITDMTIQCGPSPFQLLQQLAESYIDVKMAPGSWTLNVWNKGTKGRILGLDLTNALEADAPLTSLRHRSSPPIATTLLVRWRDNWVRRTQAPPAGHERKAKHLQVPQIPTEAGAIDLADTLLPLYAVEQVEFAADVHPRNAAQVPGIAIVEGDTVNMPNREDVLTAVRVQSWTAATQRDGRVALSIEAGDLVAHRAERIDAWLQRLSDGAIEGRSRQALPTRPDTFRYSAATVPVREIIYDHNSGDPVGESKTWTVPAPGRITDFTVDIPGGEGGTFDVYLNGVSVASITVAAATAADSQYGLAIEVTRGDVISAFSTAAIDFVLTVRMS